MKKLLTTLAIIPVIAFGQSSATFKNITVKGALKLDDSTVTSVTSGSILATKEYGEATYFNPDSSMQKLTVDTIIIGNDSLFVCPNGVLAYTGSMAVKDTLNASLLNVGDEDSCTINRPNANRGSYFDDYVTIRNKGADELMIVFRNASLASGKMLGLNGHSEGYCWVSVDPITFNVIDKIQCFYLKDNDNSTTLGGQANRSNTIGLNGGKSEVSVGGSKTNINNFKIAQPAASTGNNLVVQEQDGSTVGDTALIIDSEQKVRIYQSLVLPDGFELIDSSQLGGTVNVGDSIAMAADTAYFIEWDSIGNKPILLDSTEIMDSINSYTPLYADTAYHYTIDSTTGIDLVEPDSIEYMLVVGDDGKPRKAQTVLNENFDAEFKSVTTDSSIFFNGSNNEYSEGRLYYDKNVNNLVFYNSFTSTAHDLGRELRPPVVYNESGGLIADSSIVYIDTAYLHNGIERYCIKLAHNRSFKIARKTIGMATMNIPNNSYGEVVWKGLARGLNTSMYEPLSAIYLDTLGRFVDTVPNPPYEALQLGFIGISDDDSGTIIVDPQFPQFIPNPIVSLDTSGSDNEITINTIDVYERVTNSSNNFFNVRTQYGNTVRNDSVIITIPGLYNIRWLVQTGGTAAQTDLWNTTVFKNGSAEFETLRTTTSQSIGGVPGDINITLAFGDVLELYIRNLESTRNAFCSGGYWIVEWLSAE